VHHFGFEPLGLPVEDVARITAEVKIRDNGWPGCPYHLIVGDDERLALCQDYRTASYHVSGHNHEAIGCAIEGDYTHKEVRQRLSEIVGLAYLEACQAKRNACGKAGIRYEALIPAGHLELSPTLCPGAGGMLVVRQLRA